MVGLGTMPLVQLTSDFSIDPASVESMYWDRKDSSNPLLTIRTRSGDDHKLMLSRQEAEVVESKLTGKATRPDPMDRLVPPHAKPIPQEV